MTEATHTPGPWKWDMETGNIVDNTPSVIAVVYGSDDDEASFGSPDVAAECQANALLISRAPELLDALRALYEATGECIGCHRNSDVAHKAYITLKSAEEAQ
jgi:hypothetical protein